MNSKFFTDVLVLTLLFTLYMLHYTDEQYTLVYLRSGLGGSLHLMSDATDVVAPYLFYMYLQAVTKLPSRQYLSREPSLLTGTRILKAWQ